MPPVCRMENRESKNHNTIFALGVRQCENMPNIGALTGNIQESRIVKKSVNY